jgi:hypothetical protein
MITMTKGLNHKPSKNAMVIVKAIDVAWNKLSNWLAEAVCLLIEFGPCIYHWYIDVYHTGISWSCYTFGKCQDAVLFVLPSIDESGEKLHCSPGQYAFYIVLLTYLKLVLQEEATAS